MRRIQDFLKLNEINQTLIKEVNRETTQEAVEIWSGNFHWGVKLVKDEQEQDLKSVKASEVVDADNERLTTEPLLKDFLALKQIDLKIR